MTKEALHCGVVVAVSLAAHALGNMILRQYLAVLLVLVVPALVGVQDQIVLLRQIHADHLRVRGRAGA